MSKHYEIEIKSLLGSKENADALRNKIIEQGGKLHTVGEDKQLNHYFTYSDLQKFHENLLPYVSEDKKETFSKIIGEGKNFSIRTRQTNDRVLLVIKASLDDQTSSNGVSRMEFETEMKMTLDELDKLLLNSGLEYQAKWSREREEYKIDDNIICIDKNAGYGYLAEFESIVQEENNVEDAKKALIAMMKRFDIEELRQDRLARMFEFYNSHWQEYYGTDKVFNIE